MQVDLDTAIAAVKFPLSVLDAAHCQECLGAVQGITGAVEKLEALRLAAAPPSQTDQHFPEQPQTLEELAKWALNGWAVFARSQKESDGIAALWKRLEELTAAAPPTGEPQLPTHCHCGWKFGPDSTAEKRRESMSRCMAKPATTLPAPVAAPFTAEEVEIERQKVYALGNSHWNWAVLSPERVGDMLAAYAATLRQDAGIR